MPSLPSSEPVKRGGWLTVDHGSGMVYCAKGNKTADFYRYDPVEDAWTERSPIPAGPDGRLPYKGCRGESDGGGIVYMTKGNNTLEFWRYVAAEDTWQRLADVPEGPRGKKVKGGTDLAWVPPDDSSAEGCLYLLKGYYREFYRYDPGEDRWLALPDAPAGMKPKYDKGSWLAFDGDSTLYCHKSKYYDRADMTHEFWRYDVRGDTWCPAPLAGMPLYGLHSGRIKKKKAKDGGAGAFWNEMVWALKGGNTQQFWLYDIARDTWTETDTMPANGSTGRKKRVKYGGDLASWGAGVFFALKGNKTLECWRYVIRASADPSPARAGVMAAVAGAGPPRLAIAPNPLSGSRPTLRCILPGIGPATVSVFDAAGRRVLERRLLPDQRGTAQIDLGRLAAGVYLVRLESGASGTTAKLVLQP